ncbi:Syntaxin-18 [Actinomortierella ambigua]|uniref:Syntaxin-18 n=1 Tax=Actinomortierella ambigua TaxID=1343610 RepID=A0A9P6Q6J7_9FUNG|nr:Syntaxin-18 [Actinomortierella ambigua]
MADLTALFRATVQELDQASGSFSSRADHHGARSRTRPSESPDPWMKEAHQISRTIADMRSFILTIRPAYLNLSRSAMSSLRAPKGESQVSSSSKALQALLESISTLKVLSDKDRDSIDTQVKVMMHQVKGAIEQLESLEQAAFQLRPGGADNFTQHRQGVTLYLNEKLASLATLHKDQYEVRMAREMEKSESSLFKAIPKPGSQSSRSHLRNTTNSTFIDSSDDLGVSGGPGSLQPRRPHNSASTSNTSSPAPSLGDSSRMGGSRARSRFGTTNDDSGSGGYSSSSLYARQPLGGGGSSSNSGAMTAAYHDDMDEDARQPSSSLGGLGDEDDFERGLSAQERQMLELENEQIAQRLATELNQVRQLETSMIELSTLHSTIQEHLEIQTQQTNRLHEEALNAIELISAGNDQLLKAGKRNNSTRKWILFFLILASFVLLFLDWYD